MAFAGRSPSKEITSRSCATLRRGVGGSRAVLPQAIPPGEGLVKCDQPSAPVDCVKRNCLLPCARTQTSPQILVIDKGLEGVLQVLPPRLTNHSFDAIRDEVVDGRGLVGHDRTARCHVLDELVWSSDLAPDVTVANVGIGEVAEQPLAADVAREQDTL